MPLESGKHIEKEIEGVRCRVVETGMDEERMNFIKELLEHNGYEVKTEKEAKKAAKESEKTRKKLEKDAAKAQKAANKTRKIKK